MSWHQSIGLEAALVVHPMGWYYKSFVVGKLERLSLPANA
jgi:hypothetical protein